MINLDQCEPGDYLISDRGSVLKYLRKRDHNHVVQYLEDSTGKLYKTTGGEFPLGFRRSNGTHLSFNKGFDGIHNIVSIVRVSDYPDNTDGRLRLFSRVKELQEGLTYYRNFNTVPDNLIETEVVKYGKDGSTLYICFVEDGAEGYLYVVEAPVNKYSDLDIRRIAQADYLEACVEEPEFDYPLIDNISVEEVGRYGYTVLKTVQSTEKQNKFYE